MEDIYRNDDWLSHHRMETGQLRARHWTQSRLYFRHASLIAAESRLSEWQGGYLISFWKTLEYAIQDNLTRNPSELHVLQRVRADHPFFQQFQRESVALVSK